MEKLNHSITVNASKEKVWEILWNDATYRTWTSVFDADSHFEGDLQNEGSQVKFIGSSGAGMYAEVAKVAPNEYMSFKHLGEMGPDGEKKTYDHTPYENYTLESKDNATVVKVEVEMPKEYKEMFDELFPKALQKVKELAEE